ncbi:sigma 54-interacting transcriptional regulator [Tepidibacillus infernus]|uniref:sigma 54-interacting transcriptional regulator n=1 Tax=Tepidibacillus infernus TaxID=1806172 RepID=UPI003B7541A3
MLQTSMTLIEAAGQLERGNHDCLPVIGPGGILCGVLSQSHIVRALGQGLLPTATVKEAMETSFAIASSFDELQSLFDLGQSYVILLGKNGPRALSLREYALDNLQKGVSVLSYCRQMSHELDTLKTLIEELDTIIELSLDGIYVTDGSGYTIKVNKAYERITGIKRNEVLGRHMQELVNEGYFSQSATLLVLKKRKPVTIMQQIKGGISIVVIGTPVFGQDGKIVRVINNIRDVTELIQLKLNLEETKKLKDNYFCELTQLRSQQIKEEGIIVNSISMKQTFELALRIAPVDTTVLILGESGVGKEVMAKFIHNNSKRKGEPFIKINCGAIPPNLLESELFGYVEGAFTGAKKEGKPGLFELADKGTLLLDEIGELPLDLQVKLLRVLEEHEFTRLGGVKPIKVDVRVLSATNRDLQSMVKEGKFREDLFYRLNVVPITIPSLRERKEDIPLLVQHYLTKFNKKYEMHKQISLNALEKLVQYRWPGNIRELVNIIERLVVTVNDSEIGLNHLPVQISQLELAEISLPALEKIPLRDAVERVEKILLDRAMKRFGSTRKAAKALGMSQATLVRKLHYYFDSESRMNQNP